MYKLECTLVTLRESLGFSKNFPQRSDGVSPTPLFRLTQPFYISLTLSVSYYLEKSMFFS